MKNFIYNIYHKFISDPTSFTNSILYILFLFVTATLSWWIFNIIAGIVKKKCRNHPFFEKNDQLFILFKRAGHYLIFVLLGLYFLELFNSPIAKKIFYALVILLLASIISQIINNLIPYLERGISQKTQTHLDDMILDLSKKFSGIIIYTTGGILALDMWGINIMPFVAGAGVAGIAIGFAAKDTLSNLIAGVLLIVDRPFEVGDRIEVWTAPANSATWGDVVEIGLRATKIQTTDNIVIVIPNNEIMKRDIINYTTITDEIRVRIPIGISYEANTNKAKEIIIKISHELAWVMDTPPPKVVVKSFGDSAVNLEARVWISEPRRRIDTISHITDRVKEDFQEQNIEIPYPKRDLYIKTDADISNQPAGLDQIVGHANRSKQ
jgi:small-conductance mechanosensitive channel